MAGRRASVFKRVEYGLENGSGVMTVTHREASPPLRRKTPSPARCCSAECFPGSSCCQVRHPSAAAPAGEGWGRAAARPPCPARNTPKSRHAAFAPPQSGVRHSDGTRRREHRRSGVPPAGRQVAVPHRQPENSRHSRTVTADVIRLWRFLNIIIAI